MAPIAAEPYEFDFDPRRAALIIIDMQRDFLARWFRRRAWQ
jgi:isochorismate hydrolase